jgi:hypothetical protein
VQHQAGSDSFLTAQIFLKIKRELFAGTIDPKFHNLLYGFGPTNDLLPAVDSPDVGYQPKYYYGQPSMSATGMDEYVSTSPPLPLSASSMYFNPGPSGYYMPPYPHSGMVPAQMQPPPYGYDPSAHIPSGAFK